MLLCRIRGSVSVVLDCNSLIRCYYLVLFSCQRAVKTSVNILPNHSSISCRHNLYLNFSFIYKRQMANFMILPNKKVAVFQLKKRFYIIEITINYWHFSFFFSVVRVTSAKYKSIFIFAVVCTMLI